MSHLIGHESSRWVIGIALLFGACLPRNCFAESHKIYVNYFGDEVTSAVCDELCIEEWSLKQTYVCELVMNDMHYRQVPEYCAT